jgi:hypothetical protein
LHSALLEADPHCRLQVVPVGLQYESYQAMGRELLVSFGRPIPVVDYLKLYHDDQPKAIDQLLAKVATRLKELMVHIPNGTAYAQQKKKLEEREREQDLALRLKNDQRFLAGLQLEAANKSRTVKKPLLLKVLGFPLYLYCLINHLLPIITIRYIMNRFVRDHHWTSSIRFAGMILITPLFYLLQSGILYWISGNWMWLVIYFLSLIFSAWFGSRYWIHFPEFRLISAGKWNKKT